MLYHSKSHGAHGRERYLEKFIYFRARVFAQVETRELSQHRLQQLQMTLLLKQSDQNSSIGVVREQKDASKSPVMPSFPATKNSVRGKAAISDGTVPSSLLNPRLSLLRLVQFPISRGIVPVN